jgi:hypothetical protein
MEFEMKPVRIVISTILLIFSLSGFASVKSYNFDLHYTLNEEVRLFSLENRDGGPISFAPAKVKASGAEGEITFSAIDNDYSSSDFFYLGVYYKSSPFGPFYLKIPLRFRSYTRTNVCSIFGVRGAEILRCKNYWFF